MFIVISIMVIGIVVGYVCRNVLALKNISKTISGTIFLLLFFLGLSIGANDKLVESLPKLGWQAGALALAASLGSAVAAWLVYKFFFKGKDNTMLSKNGGEEF